MASVARSPWCTLYTAVVGALDLVSGLVLVFAPARALALAGLEPEDDLLFLSFVGTFVAAIGLVYLGAACDWMRRREAATLRAVWVSTAVVRVLVGGFVIAQVALDSLESLWIWVGLIDLGCALVQVVGWRRGWIAAGEQR